VKQVGFIYQGNSSKNRIDYVLDFINTHPLNGRVELKSQDILEETIYYGLDTSETDWFIPRQQIIFSDRKYSSHELKSNCYLHKADKVYSVEGESKTDQIFLKSRRFQFDLLEAIFFHISRYEEYGIVQLNEWDALKESEHFLVRNQLEKTPVVDHLIISFVNAITNQETKKTTFTISHDIDFIRKFSRPFDKLKKGLGFIKRGEWLALKNYRNQLKVFKETQKDPYDVFEEILKKESINKEIYYLVGGNHTFDTPIDLSDPIFKKSINLAKDRGYQIGIHPSYLSWTSTTLARNEKKVLEEEIQQQVFISRQHYLHFSFPKTILVLEELGIRKDSSIGFNRRIGFRCGTGFPYTLYVLGEERRSELIEQPLIYMDSSIIKESKKKKELILKSTVSFIEENKYNTHITFNFHNSRFEESDLNDLGLREIYQSLFEV